MKRENIYSQLRFSGLAALLYCTSMFFFLRSDKFEGIWILYIGNILFGVSVALFMLRHIAYRHEGASTTSTVTAGHLVAIGGIALAAIITFILMLLMIPELFSDGNAKNVAAFDRVQEVSQNHSNLVLTAYMSLVIGNIAAGSFMSIIFAYTAKINQTRDKESNLLKEKAVKKSAV